MAEASLSRAAARVQAALAACGVDAGERELPASTRTAREAAAALGCVEAQIAKSLVFLAVESARALLVIASGANQVSLEKLAALCGEPVARADAAFVRDATGYAIGGVPPLGHAQPLATWIDRDLLDLPLVWAAAGTPNAVFALTPAALVDATAGIVADVAAR